MQASDEYVASPSIATVAVMNRLKREDCKRTKDGPAFYKWKTLVGPNDWKDYSVGKEGAERYRTSNLPDCTSCTGVYELGIVDSRSGKIIRVYVGQTGNIRTRLQQYGRDGGHLENGCSNTEFPRNEDWSCQKGCGLFTEALSKGHSIVYRWAPMKSKKDAEKTEAWLLDKYNYAWNKRSNGPRRCDDVLDKAKPPAIRKSLQKLKGVNIGPLLLESGSGFYGNTKSTEFIPNVLKFGISRPIIISRNFGANGNPNTICAHKGRKISDSPLLETKQKEHYVHGPIIERSSSNDYQQITGKASKKHTICGVDLNDGTFCTKKPPEGRKRCEEHKGLRIKEPISEIPDSLPPKASARKGHGNAASPAIDGSATCGATLSDGSGRCCSRKPAEGNRRCWQHKGMRAESSPTSSRALPSISKQPSHASTCGAPTLDGYSCNRKPAAGSARCWQHAEKSPGGFGYYNTSPQFQSYSSYGSYYESYPSTCGAPTVAGHSCNRKPAAGSVRCWQHAEQSPRGVSYYNAVSRSPSYSSYGSFYENHSSTCGARTQKGYPCTRRAAAGSGRCWQHGG